MKTLASYLMLAVAAMTLLSGCAPAIQLGVALSGSLTASIHEANKTPEQKGVLKKQREPVQVNELITETSIGSNIVKINRGWYQETFSIVFSVTRNGELTERIHKVVPIEKYSDEIGRIKSMTDAQKKEYARSNLLAQNIDLEAKEMSATEMTETRPLKVAPRETPKTATGSPTPFTTPGFTPQPR